ncbi:response regulator transcription factor [Bacillus timonensis]|uniref:response regulator transcription factor n=1 Tax=Bacillus timonensis TaxID=1033734 RepID=UPI00138666F7|nr:LuxR C-terminal-related transcriptional regulator [Bacillus timonensis]
MQQLSLKDSMESLLLKGLQIIGANKESIRNEWKRILHKEIYQLEQGYYAKILGKQLEKILFQHPPQSVSVFFDRLHQIKMPLSPIETHHILIYLASLENIIHKIIRPDKNSTYHEYHAIHYLFSKMSKELVSRHSHYTIDQHQSVRLSDISLTELLSTLQVKIESEQKKATATHDYEHDALLLFNQWIMRSGNFQHSVENIISGFVHCLPFTRCALFTHEREKGVGLMGYRLKGIEKITENISNILPVVHNIKKLINLQPIYIANAEDHFPVEYVQKFQLKSVVMVPLFVSSKNKLTGIAILDCGENKSFELSQELLVPLMRFGQSAAELLNAHWEGKVSSMTLVPEKPLTPREIDVLQLMANGLSIAEAANELKLSSYTVRDYVSTIIKKLGAKNRTHAAVLGASRGFISLKA